MPSASSPFSSSRLQHLLARLPLPLLKMLSLLATLLSYLTLRNLLLTFLLLNLKNLPLAWELRLLYRGYKSWRTKRDVAHFLTAASTSPSATSLSTSTTSSSQPSSLGLPATTHPLFLPHTMHTLTPLLETDHNLHKSNSTYFSDLDESRTALVVHLLSSTNFSPKELEGEGYKGAFAVILGSVHASFLREIKPYEGYAVRSRVLGWDGKWILIGSVFVRGKNGGNRRREERGRDRKGKGEKREDEKEDQRDEVLLASCLSKYVVKKGRFTVPPERCFRSAGWLPEKTASEPTPPLAVDSSAAPTPDTEPVNGEVKITEEDLRRKAQETAAKAADQLRKGISGEKKLSKADEACREAASRWSWEDIDAERARGLKIAESWLGLDRALKELWEGEGKR